MYFTKSADEVLKDLEVSQELGLTSDQAEKNLQKFGKNELPSKPPKPIWKMFAEQINDWLIYILLVAAILTASMGHPTDSVIILLVVIINATLGVVQESKANKAVEALKNMSSPTSLVRRDGKVTEIASKDVVVGDILLLDAGRIIAADVRLIESQELQIEESALTGESVPSKKDANKILDEKAGIGDRKNMAFMSTVVTNGRAEGVVVATGGNTEVGHIAHILDSEETPATPLEIRLEHLGKTLGKIAIVVCIIMAIVSYINTKNWQESAINAVALAVASIPEGLAAIVAVVLSIGVTKMSKQNAIIKRLPAVETLGSVNVICSDKTGTLTQNKMTIVEIFTMDGAKKITEKTENNFTESEKLLAKGMFIDSDATLENGVSTGDPTEVALLVLADKLGFDRKKIAKNSSRIAEFPFDSDRKLMSVQIEEDSIKTVYTKGAIDNILEISTHILKNGKVEKISENNKKEILAKMGEMSDQALRTLGLAYKETDSKIEASEMEKNLIFVGMVGMIDPPRIEVKDSIAVAKSAGITPVMITGDYAKTAFAIAKELGIATDFSEAVTGKEIDEMDEKTFSEKVKKYKVFARVSPEHKVRIVRALRSHGNIVSMTGDGVNDAPSLNAADIGVAMGITGTDVAKGAASMILLDDNFTTIVKAVEQGRIIYSNIKKSILFLLSCNLGEVVAMFFVILVGLPTPLQAIQLLWINLVTDSFPAVALGMDKGDSEVMKEKPRSPKESFFSGGAGTRTILLGTLVGIVTIGAFVLGFYEQGLDIFANNFTENQLQYSQTMAFMTLIFAQMFLAISMRSDYHTIFSKEFFANKILLATIAISIGLQFILMYTPFLREIFHLEVITGNDWLFVIGLAAIPMIINEIRKFFKK